MRARSKGATRRRRSVTDGTMKNHSTTTTTMMMSTTRTIDRDDGNDASLAIVAGTRETRVGDGDEEAGGRGRAADERRRAPISVKAPPLLKEQISRLSEAEQRKVLGRWNARLRGLKRRVEDMSHQFPTSSLVLVFTKPFRSKDRRGKWCVVRDDDARFVSRATRCHATED